MFQNLDTLKLALRNFTSLSILQIATYVFPFFTIPYITSVVGVSNYGKLAFVSSVVAYFGAVVEYGFNYTATRDISVNRNDKKRVEQIYLSTLYSKLFLFIVSLAIYLLLIFNVTWNGINTDLLLYSFLILLANALNPVWFFQGIESMQAITVLGIISSCLYLFGVFIVITDKSDYILLPLLTAIPNLIVSILSIIYIKIRYGISLRLIKSSKILESLRAGFNFFIAEWFPNLYNNSATFVLGYIGNFESVGLFDASKKLLTLGTPWLNVLTRASFPMLSKSMDNFMWMRRVTIALSICFSIIVFFSSEFIFNKFIDVEYHDAIILSRIMSFGFIFLGVYHLYGFNYLLTQGHDRVLRIISIGGSITGSVITCILIYFFLELGAVLGVTFSRAFLAILVYVQYKKVVSDRYRD